MALFVESVPEMADPILVTKTPTMKELHQSILATLSTQVATTRYGKRLAGLPVDEKTAALTPAELLEKLVANMAGNLAMIMHAQMEDIEEAAMDLEICADCEESTAPGTPDPHVCGSAKVCQGCDEEGHVLAPYRITMEGGEIAVVNYCDDCRDLAKMNWNGETLGIEPATVGVSS